jgi:sorbitol-specific phosphotransferase system component IIC
MFLKRVIQGDATSDQAKDTGMALVLGMLLVWLGTGNSAYVAIAMVAHIINMVAPQVFRPAAVVWLGFAEALGTVTSRVVLAVVFIVVVTPIALLRRALGVDTLRLRGFKAKSDSVMVERNKRFVGTDLEKPY